MVGTPEGARKGRVARDAAYAEMRAKPMDPTVVANVRAGLARVAATRDDGFDPEYEFTREDAADLARRLQTAFVWAETEEGHGFWSDVWARIRAIARTATKGPGLPWENPEKKTWREARMYKDGYVRSERSRDDAAEAARGLREVIGWNPGEG